MEDAVDVGHPLYEKAGIDVWMSTFTGNSPGRRAIPQFYKFQRLVECASFDKLPHYILANISCPHTACPNSSN